MAGCKTYDFLIERPKRPEMHIFNPAYVITLIYPNPPIQRLSIKSINEVACGRMGAKVNRLVGVDQQNVDDRDVDAASAANGPWIGNRIQGNLLMRI